MSLLTPDLLRRLEQFQLLAQRRAKSSAKGERRSKARGQSVEFADHRNYTVGDDFRYLDWNLFGRLDRLFLKLYEEERELPPRARSRTPLHARRPAPRGSSQSAATVRRAARIQAEAAIRFRPA